MGKKVIVIVCIIAALTVGIALLILVPRDVSIVTTTSSFISSNYHFYDSNPILRIKIPASSLNEEKYKEIQEQQKKSLEEAYITVLQADSGAFTDEYTSYENTVFETELSIYYYRTEDVDHFYKLDKATGDITPCEFSGYNGFTDTLANAKFDQVSHNFTTFVSIRTEGLIDTYPGLKKAIESLDGEFYYAYMYYSDGRIFFDVRNTIYEYLPDKDKVSKVATVGAGETIEMIRCQ